MCWFGEHGTCSPSLLLCRAFLKPQQVATVVVFTSLDASLHLLLLVFIGEAKSSSLDPVSNPAQTYFSSSGCVGHLTLF